MADSIRFDVRTHVPATEIYRRAWTPGPGLGLAGMWIGAVVDDNAGLARAMAAAVGNTDVPLVAALADPTIDVVGLATPHSMHADELVAGAKLPIALYRMEGKSPRQYLAWSPTLTRKPNFHVPDKFGALVVR